MVLLDNLGRFRKGRLWLDDTPDIQYDPVGTIKDNIYAISHETWEKKAVCLELLMLLRHTTKYGLLGIEYIPEASDHTELEVCIGKDRDRILDDSLAHRIDKVHLGVPKTYAEAVFQTGFEVMQTGIIPSGHLKIDLGAYGEMGSNGLIFSQITRIILKIVMTDLKNLKKEDAEKIVLSEIDKKDI